MHAAKLLAIYVSWKICIASGKVYNKTYARLGELPYTVFLEVHNLSRCTGVIVSEFWVLTAAHCLVMFRTKVPKDAIRILAGVTDYKFYDPSDVQEIFSENYFVHPNYKGTVHDLGVIKLSNPLKFNNNVNKAKISAHGWPVNAGLVCTASGFGQIEHFIDNFRLKKVVVDAFHGEDQCLCLRIRGAMDEMLGSRREDYARYSVCVLDSPTGMCVGDSGGPLVCNGTVVGINSMLMPLTCAPSPFICTTPNFFHVFTYLCPHLEWLAEYVPEVPHAPLSCDACRSSAAAVCTVVVVCVVTHF